VSGLAWNSGNGSFITLTSNSLAAGNYTLAVRGHVNGSSGGAYSGVLNVAPVPEASVMALMLAGIGVIGFFGLRRRGNTA
jgi:hypothetical protein